MRRLFSSRVIPLAFRIFALIGLLAHASSALAQECDGVAAIEDPLVDLGLPEAAAPIVVDQIGGQFAAYVDSDDVESFPIWRLQVEISTCAGLFWSRPSVRLRNNGDYFYLSSPGALINAEEYYMTNGQGSATYRWDVVYPAVGHVEDIERLEITIGSVNGACIKGVRLLVNDSDVIFDSGATPIEIPKDASHEFSADELRASPLWNPETLIHGVTPPTVIPADMIRSIVGAMIGNLLAQNSNSEVSLYWMPGSNAPIQLTGAADDTIAFELKAQAYVRSDIKLKVNLELYFDLHVLCEDDHLAWQLENPSMDFDVVGLDDDFVEWLANLFGYELPSIDDIDINSFNTLGEFATNLLPFCPEVSVESDGTIVVDTAFIDLLEGGLCSHDVCCAEGPPLFSCSADTEVLCTQHPECCQDTWSEACRFALTEMNGGCCDVIFQTSELPPPETNGVLYTPVFSSSAGLTPGLSIPNGEVVPQELSCASGSLVAPITLSASGSELTLPSSCEGECETSVSIESGSYPWSSAEIVRPFLAPGTYSWSAVTSCSDENDDTRVSESVPGASFTIGQRSCSGQYCGQKPIITGPLDAPTGAGTPFPFLGREAFHPSCIYQKMTATFSYEVTFYTPYICDEWDTVAGTGPTLPLSPTIGYGDFHLRQAAGFDFNEIVPGMPLPWRGAFTMQVCDSIGVCTTETVEAGNGCSPEPVAGHFDFLNLFGLSPVRHPASLPDMPLFWNPVISDPSPIQAPIRTTVPTNPTVPYQLIELPPYSSAPLSQQPLPSVRQ